MPYLPVKENRAFTTDRPQGLGMVALHIQGVLEIQDAHRPQGGPVLPGLSLDASQTPTGHTMNAPRLSGPAQHRGNGGTSIIRNTPLLGPYSRTMPRVLWGS